MKSILDSFDLVKEGLNQELYCLEREQFGELIADKLLPNLSFVLWLSFVGRVALHVRPVE